MVILISPNEFIQDDKYPIKCRVCMKIIITPRSNFPILHTDPTKPTAQACYIFRFWLLARFQSSPLPHLARRMEF